ncbi:MAG: penicillin-binding protein 2 [bacterium]|nr:penicillin-binding protein 2 [bacterium]
MLKSFFKKDRFIKREPDVDFHDVFSDLLSEEKETLKDRKFELPLGQENFYLAFFVILAILAFFWISTFYLQIIKGSYYQDLAFSNKNRVYFIRPDRGIFYDRNEKQLLWNNSSFDFICDQRDMDLKNGKKESIFKEIAGLLGSDVLEVEKKFEDVFDFQVLVKENVSQDFLVNFSLKSDKIKGCYLKENKIRKYPEGGVFSHIFGYLSKINKPELETKKDLYSISDYIGKSGLEKTYEDILRGTAGKIIEERDSAGRTIKTFKSQEPTPGKSLKLWIDSGLQKKSYEALQRSLENVNSSAGAVVILNAKNGGVLSMASLPSYDNNLFAQGISVDEYNKLINNKDCPLYNRVISGLYPSGSTIKPLIAVAGLEEKIINKNTTINCKGGISVKSPYDETITYEFPDWKTHGIVDLKKALAESCNVFFYMVGGGYKSFKGLGVDGIEKYLHLFNWGMITGIDLFGEKEGQIPNPEWKEKEKKEMWYPGDTYHLSIGQGDILITPLQVATSFVAIANEGALYKPQIVDKIISSQNKETIIDIEPEIIRKDFVDVKNIKLVKEGMLEAVLSPDGSSHLLNSLPIKVGAKTGTAQFGPKARYHSWITVFAPYEDPELVITVVVEGVAEGRVAAIPVAKEILEWYYNK